jgi:hypothetical protein
MQKAIRLIEKSCPIDCSWPKRSIQRTPTSNHCNTVSPWSSRARRLRKTSCFLNPPNIDILSAITISSVFYFLLKNPRCYSKLQEEVASLLYELNNPAISFATAQALPHLNACINESMRLHVVTRMPRSSRPSHWSCCLWPTHPCWNRYWRLRSSLAPSTRDLRGRC